MVARAHSPQVCALCGREAHCDPRAAARSGTRAAGPAATAFDSGFELILDKELGVTGRWTRVVHRLWRLAFKRRCFGHLGQWLRRVKKRGKGD